MEQQKSETKTKKKFNLAALFAPTDMTEGSPGKRIVAFAIPMLIGNIAQQLYNTVDSIVVGRYVGDNALAAVGSASPILKPSAGSVRRNFRGCKHYGFPVFRGETERGAVRLHRLQYHADSHILGHYYGGGALCGEASAAAAEYAGQHYGLVRFLPYYSVRGHCRHGLLQYFKRYPARAWGFRFRAGVSAGGHGTEYRA